MADHGFVFLPSYYEAIRPLDDEDRLALLDAVLDFVFQGAEPGDLKPILAGYFLLLKPNIEASMKRYTSSVENGKKGGRPPKQKPSENPNETQEKPGENQEKDKDMDKDKDKEFMKADKPPKTSRFIPPSLEEIEVYCRERGNTVDPRRFLDHYEATGWMRGTSKIKSWKACVRTWERREQEGVQPSTPAPSGHYINDQGEVIFTRG